MRPIPLWQQVILDKLQANKFELEVLIPQRELAARVRQELDDTARLRRAEEENAYLKAQLARWTVKAVIGGVVDATPIDDDVAAPSAASWRDVDEHAKAMARAKKRNDMLDAKLKPETDDAQLERYFPLVTGNRRGHGAKWS